MNVIITYLRDSSSITGRAQGDAIYKALQESFQYPVGVVPQFVLQGYNSRQGTFPLSSGDVVTLFNQNEGSNNGGSNLTQGSTPPAGGATPEGLPLQKIFDVVKFLFHRGNPPVFLVSAIVNGSQQVIFDFSVGDGKTRAQFDAAVIQAAGLTNSTLGSAQQFQEETAQAGVPVAQQASGGLLLGLFALLVAPSILKQTRKSRS